MFSSANLDVTDESPANRHKLALAVRIIEEAKRRVLVRGFHGEFAIKLSIQDGTIQHVASKTEQMER